MSNDGKTTTEFAVLGMTCASCVARVEKAIRKVPGVESASVSLATEKATVTGSAPLDAVFAAIEKIGYHAATLREGEQPKPAIQAGRELANFILAAALSLPVLAISMFEIRFNGAGWLQFALTVPVLFVAGREFFIKAISLLRHFGANMDTLIAMGSFAAFGFSTAILLSPRAENPHLYFETGAMIVTLILLGRFLEATAKGRASSAIRELMALQPETALVKRGDDWVETRISALRKGDIILVRPGDKIPVDGVVIDGVSNVDESMISGESIPVRKEKDTEVIGATINGTGSLVIRATKIGADTVLAQIIRLVEQAQASKAPVQRLVDKVAGIFVPAVIIVAAVTFALWLILNGNIDPAIRAAVAVLVIACPCSLGLATPTAVIVGTGVAAKKGILIRDAESLQLAEKLQVLVIDKTGTITEGKPRVVAFKNLSPLPNADVLALVGSCERRSEHPLADAIVRYCETEGAKFTEPSEFESLTGAGVSAVVHGRAILVGNREFIQSAGVDTSPAPAPEQSAVYAAVNGQLAALFEVADPVKPTSADAIAALRKMSVQTILASGDTEAIAWTVARQVGIGAVRAPVKPRDKARIVQELRQHGTIVGMVGDGINDAPALAAADIGFAIGTGADVAKEAAQVTLVGGDITKVATAVRLSKATMRTIRQNLFWAFGYNTLAIPVAALGLLHPMIAAAAMALSSVSVVTNSLRLRHR
jgi:Cu+-exporting ATPase